MAKANSFMLTGMNNTVSPSWTFIKSFYPMKEPVGYVRDIIVHSVAGDVIYCSDLCAEAINESIRDLDNPKFYSRYETIDDFLKSLE